MVNGGFGIAISVLKWSVPVDPKSTSASSPPIPFPIWASGAPWKTGVAPNGAVHTFVWNNRHDSPVNTAVPSAPIATAGSLLPLL